MVFLTFYLSYSDFLLGGRTVIPSGGLILSLWYKYQIFELYVTQHPDQRFLFLEHLRAQDQLERLQVEHNGLVSKFEQRRKRGGGMVLEPDGGGIVFEVDGDDVGGVGIVFIEDGLPGIFLSIGGNGGG
ncbi:hypothetical protein Tco_1292294 [Tanacetum coccineum]